MNTPDPFISPNVKKLLRFNKLVEELRESCSWKAPLKSGAYWMLIFFVLIWGIEANFMGVHFALLYSGALTVVFGLEAYLFSHNRKQVELMLEIFRDLEEKIKDCDHNTKALSD